MGHDDLKVGAMDGAGRTALSLAATQVCSFSVCGERAHLGEVVSLTMGAAVNQGTLPHGLCARYMIEKGALEFEADGSSRVFFPALLTAPRGHVGMLSPHCGVWWNRCGRESVAPRCVLERRW